jgi:hypothetical protein
LIKGTIHYKNFKRGNVYISNESAPNFMKKILEKNTQTDLKKMIVDDFNTPFSPIDVTYTKN